jgi:hypothetical protein
MHQRSRISVVLFLAVLFFSAQAHAADEDARIRALSESKTAAAASRLSSLDIVPEAGCTPVPLTSPATISGNISSSSCFDSVIGSYEDIYNLQGVAGQTVTIDYSSTAYSVFLWMEGVRVDTISYLSTGGVSHQRIVYTFPTTRTYKLEAETLYGPGDSQAHTGPYTLIVNNGGCATNATTMCLNNGRFAVSATYSTGTSSGQASALKLTADSGYLTFFNASNIEVVIKVLDACGLNSRYWVYAGGLTNVNTVITVRDTKTGTVKTYTNPANTPFQPIQDSGALAVCP